MRLAINSFGQGHGSLVHLRRAPIDLLKIDDGFVRDLATRPRDVDVVRGILRLAESLDQEVIADGVETPEQLRCLRELACPLGQGALFGEALTSAQFATVAAELSTSDSTRAAA